MISTSFAFLPEHDHFDILDCCNGLLLCRLHLVLRMGHKYITFFKYVVCNPFTEKWFTLPSSGQLNCVLITRLGFDPVQSSHFHVFQLVKELSRYGDLEGVAVYSSETERWVYMEKRNEGVRLPYGDSAYGDSDSAGTVFLDGRLYFHTLVVGIEGLAAVDTEGETWTSFAVPRRGLTGGLIQQSQGRLHYANLYRDEDNIAVRLAVYVLENYESKEWVQKHIVETSYIFGEINVDLDLNFEWVGIHPECNLIFFTAGQDNTFMCYNMDHRQVKVIRNLQDGEPPYLPYVPLYAELPSLHTVTSICDT